MAAPDMWGQYEVRWGRHRTSNPLVTKAGPGLRFIPDPSVVENQAAALRWLRRRYRGTEVEFNTSLKAAIEADTGIKLGDI